MRDLVRLTYVGRGNEPALIDPESVCAIHRSERDGKTRIMLDCGATIRVSESTEQAYSILKQENAPATRGQRERPRLSRRVGQRRSKDGD